MTKSITINNSITVSDHLLILLDSVGAVTSGKSISVNTEKLAEAVFGFVSKQSIKIVVEKIVIESTYIREDLLTLIQVMSSSLSLNKDLIFGATSKFDSKGIHIDYNQIKPLNIKKLLKYYPEKRVISLCFENPKEWEFLNDIRSMLIQVEKSDIDCKLPKKPKSLKEIHDKLSVFCARLGIEDYSLNQREDILKLDNQSIDNDMIIRVPKTHLDLVILGEKLNFCIGNGYYSRQVSEGRDSIVAIFDKNKPLYGVQFSRYAIKQAYGFGNKRIPKSILLSLQESLISKPVLPDDFISVEHSFMNGYKYDDVNLYVMFKSGGIYMYEDVDQSTYDDFISAESRGRYFAKVIKPNFSFIRIK